MPINVTGTYMPASVALSMYDCGVRLAILHVPPHVSLVRALMQHSRTLDEADVVLRTTGLDVVQGRYQVLDPGDNDGVRMSTLIGRTGARHLTTPEDDIGHVVFGARAIAAMGPCVSRVVGEKPPQAHTSDTAATRA